MWFGLVCEYAAVLVCVLPSKCCVWFVCVNAFYVLVMLMLECDGVCLIVSAL